MVMMKNKIVVLTHCVEKLKAQLHFSQRERKDFCCSNRSRLSPEEQVEIPEDVKEGHFAVLAAKTKKPQRFVVKLQLLNNPAFLRLLERAEEEYGFEQTGVLTVPCQPEELQRILQHETHSHCKEKP